VNLCGRQNNLLAGGVEAKPFDQKKSKKVRSASYIFVCLTTFGLVEEYFTGSLSWGGRSARSYGPASCLRPAADLECVNVAHLNGLAH